MSFNGRESGGGGDIGVEGCEITREGLAQLFEDHDFLVIGEGEEAELAFGSAQAPIELLHDGVAGVMAAFEGGGLVVIEEAIGGWGIAGGMEVLAGALDDPRGFSGGEIEELDTDELGGFAMEGEAIRRDVGEGVGSGAGLGCGSVWNAVFWRFGRWIDGWIGRDEGDAAISAEKGFWIAAEVAETGDIEGGVIG